MQIEQIDLNAVSLTDVAVLAAIVADGKALVIRSFDPERPNRIPMWKFAGGELEEGESPNQTLVREIEDETGFEIPHQKQPDGTLVLGDSTVSVHLLSSPIINTINGSHIQYRFLIKVKDVRDILHLDGQIRKEDDDETIETKVFKVRDLVGLSDFLYYQQQMLMEVLHKLEMLEAA